jgi:glycosyltransferase involved in cell wall biosynthesis
MLLENNPYPADVRVRQEAESLVEAGHRVCVIAPRSRGQPRRELVRGVQVRRFRAPAGADGTLSLLAEYLVANIALHAGAARELLRGASVLHLHNPPDTLFMAGLAARALGRRVVFDHHDLFPELVMARMGSRAWAALARAGERACMGIADVVLAANQSHAEIARSRGRKRASSVRVVRNGPSAASVEVAPALREGRLADPRLVYVGAIADQDGVELLADVLAELRDAHGLSSASLTVVGDGPALGRVQARMAATGVGEQVRFTGWIDAEGVWEQLRAADICLDPAPPSELNQRSTMVKIAEYLAAGKPVAAFDLCETARSAGDAAVLVAGGEPGELAAAVAALARDGEWRADLARRALERARALTWEHSARELLAAYERL